LSGSLNLGNAVQAGSEKLVCQTHGGCDPVRGPPVSSQKILPVKILGQRLQHDGDVAQPQGAVRTMLQHVYTHVAEMIFGPQYPHVDIRQPYQLRTLVDIIQRRAVELWQTLVPIDCARLGPRSGKCSHRGRILFRPNTQVDVSIGP
jgi:hypothetical protein